MFFICTVKVCVCVFLTPKAEAITEKNYLFTWEKQFVIMNVFIVFILLTSLQMYHLMFKISYIPDLLYMSIFPSAS